MCINAVHLFRTEHINQRFCKYASVRYLVHFSSILLAIKFLSKQIKSLTHQQVYRWERSTASPSPALAHGCTYVKSEKLKPRQPFFYMIIVHRLCLSMFRVFVFLHRMTFFLPCLTLCNFASNCRIPILNPFFPIKMLCVWTDKAHFSHLCLKGIRQKWGEGGRPTYESMWLFLAAEKRL